MTERCSAGVLLAVGIVLSLSGSGAAGAQPGQRVPVLATPHFALYSDFETNLNDALVNSGLARKDKKPELFHSGAEAPCFEKLAPSQRAAWDGAVDYYSKIISPAAWDARQQVLIRLDLVGFEAELKASNGTEFAELARGFRSVAAPAYRACRWPAQDEKNRRWIAEIEPRLAADEARLAARIEQLYQAKWKTLPILVDLVETVDWSGANSSWSDAGQGDLLISSTVGGASGFEILFHESSHILMGREAPIRRALETAAEAASSKLPGDLWHLVLFYTTGEAVRPFVEKSGAAGYKTMLSEIMERGGWTEYREVLEEHWRPYVEGKRSLAEAATSLIGALRAKGPK